MLDPLKYWPVMISATAVAFCKLDAFNFGTAIC